MNDAVTGGRGSAQVSFQERSGRIPHYMVLE